MHYRKQVDRWNKNIINIILLYYFNCIVESTASKTSLAKMLKARQTAHLLNKLTRSTTVTKRVAPKSTLTSDDLSSSKSSVHKGGVTDVHKQVFSNSISWASPESDFCTSHLLIKSQYTDLEHDQKSDSAKEWSDAFSGHNEEDAQRATDKAKDTFFQQLQTNSLEQNKLAYSVSFTSAEGDFCNPVLTEMLTDNQKKQLNNTSLLASLPHHDDANQLNTMSKLDKPKEKRENSEMYNLEYQELRAHADLLGHEEPLPINMQEATRDDDDRAIVITEAQVPFRIVNVNTAWENLCGFSKDECNGKTLKCIQGEETNHAAITALMSQLLRGEEAGTLLMNYRKDGSKFLNRLRVGVLRDDHNLVTHFVGVLKEVKEMEDQFYQGSKILA